MSSTISSAEVQNDWDGGGKPLKASYGKLMMWFFIVSDALTFSGFLFHTDLQDLNILIHGQLPMKCLLTFHFYMELMRQCIMWP